MKATYNWLKEFVEIKIPPEALAEKLTMAGLEVTSLEKRGNDSVFEIEITSNRPDWLSVIGIAREVAAITRKKLRARSYGSVVTKKQGPALKIEIQNKKDCPLYTAKIIRGIKVGPSPQWLKDRLELIGCRSVNNVVDATNYILFTYGEPLHAFDLDKLKGDAILVRRAKPAEKITTIDGEERTLGPEILIIADEGGPVAVAGVMGSKYTEVTQVTRNMLLEAALFNPVVVRRSRRSLAIQSESSYRFERGVSQELVGRASAQAAALIQKLAGGRCVLAKSSGRAPSGKRSVVLDSAAVNKILGVDIRGPGINKILTALEFKTKRKAGNRFAVGVPGHRLDVASQIDLIEEIARIYGYGRIAETLPAVRPQVSTLEARESVSLIKGILVSLGLNEVITYSLMDKDLLRDFRMYEGSEVIEVLNPLSKEQEILRPRLIPALAARVAYNLNQRQDYVNIFEVAEVFSQPKSRCREELMLGIALCGIKSLLLGEGQLKDTSGFLHLKGITEALFARLGIKDYNFKIQEGDSAIAVYVASERIGVMAALDKPVLDKLGIKNKDVFVLELSLERLLFYINLKRKFSGVPIYPGISRDISFILKDDVLAGDILGAVKAEGSPLLKEARVTDYYRGKQIPSGFKGLTLSCLYRSDERTLTEAEINPVHALVCKVLAERFGAQIRSCPPTPST